MKMNDKVYEVLKWITLVVLPASITLFNVIIVALTGADFIDPMWNDIAGVVSQIGAGVIAFLGALLGISTAEYNKEL